MNVMTCYSVKNIVEKLFLLFMMGFAFCACGDDESYTLGVWHRRSDLDGLARGSAAGFTIADKGYVCGGYTGTTYKRVTDLWEYDIQGGYWTQCASMPDAATARTGASGFAIGEKGYITLGQDNSSNYLADTWEYDPATDTWTQKDDYKGGARISAIAFGIGQYGYVGTGYNGNYQKDFYRFDPQAAAGQQWEIVNGFGGQKRQGGTSFVIDDKAYICCGVNNGSYVYDFWCFDPSTGVFTQLRDIADTSDDDYDDDYTSIVRANAVSFVIDGKGYLVTGEYGSLLSNYWIYDPATDLWEGEDLTAFEGSVRKNAVAFSTGTRGFVVTGQASSSYYDDTWELSPYEYEEE